MPAQQLPNIVDATASYERWLGRCVPLHTQDIKAKHELMAGGTFPFLRGTFYRWLQVWPRVCAELAGAPVVLAVGDLHVENFGTWRDAEGRLVWGVNDFDEAYPLPYTNDLVRLATSTLLAIDTDHLSLKPRSAIDAILAGYAKGFECGGSPFVIDAAHHWFIPLLTGKSKFPDRKTYWSHLQETLKSAARSKAPPQAIAALAKQLPPGAEQVQTLRRQAGVGSLGKPRFLAIAHWLGAPVAREIKALTPSACVWNQSTDLSKGGKSKPRDSRPASYIPQLIQSTTAKGLRCPDPFFHVDAKWVARRLAFDSRKIELNACPAVPDEIRLLEAMGHEVSNIHLACTKVTAAIRADLGRRDPKWLYTAAQAMLDATVGDQKEWKRSGR